MLDEAGDLILFSGWYELSLRKRLSWVRAVMSGVVKFMSARLLLLKAP